MPTPLVLTTRTSMLTETSAVPGVEVEEFDGFTLRYRIRGHRVEVDAFAVTATCSCPLGINAPPVHVASAMHAPCPHLFGLGPYLLHDCAEVGLYGRIDRKEMAA